jgi:hypothetical protein
VKKLIKTKQRVVSIAYIPYIHDIRANPNGRKDNEKEKNKRKLCSFCTKYETIYKIYKHLVFSALSCIKFVLAPILSGFKVGNSSILPVPKTNALEQYNTRVRVVSFYTTQGLG